MSKKKESFIVYYEWMESFAGLTDEQLGQLFRAIYAYELSDTPYQGSDPAISMAMSFVQSMLRRNKERYEEVCETNRLNARKRWDSSHTDSGS